VDPARSGLWALFVQSFDVFTVLLMLGSLAAVTIIVRCMLDVRASKIIPAESLRTMADLIRGRRFDDLKDFAAKDASFPARVVHGVIEQHGTPDKVRGSKDAVRETAELVASEEVGRWFRAIEPLNVVGNLGPLIGLAGTVWGMILAFTSLGDSGGQAGPTDLSLGISKALFHTLLGLVLAIPCLLVFGFYRSIVDRLCTRAMLESSRLVDLMGEAGEGRAGEVRAAGAGRDAKQV
jgi:biopolymer transport protein ExbB